MIAYVVGTMDTKGAELDYVAELLRAAGTDVVTVDVSTGRADGGGADVAADEVAAAHPDGVPAVFTGDRGSAVAAMAVALQRFLLARGPTSAACSGSAAPAAPP